VLARRRATRRLRTSWRRHPLGGFRGDDRTATIDWSDGHTTALSWVGSGETGSRGRHVAAWVEGSLHGATLVFTSRLSLTRGLEMTGQLDPTYPFERGAPCRVVDRAQLGRFVGAMRLTNHLYAYLEERVVQPKRVKS
jgi:hypothetical protein